MTIFERIEELQEKRNEFVLNESVYEDENPSWFEVAEAQDEAERRWNETDDGKELKRLFKTLSESFGLSLCEYETKG